MSPQRPKVPHLGEEMATKLFVGNLPRSATDVALTDFVSAAGFQVASAVVIRDKMTGDSKGFGFVELGEGQDLQAAIQALNGKSLDGRPLTVNEAKPPRNDFGGPRRGGPGGGGNRGGGGGFEKRRRDW
jgi:cold-inducible RNA-binding protein